MKQLLVTTKDAWQSLGIGRTRFFEILRAGDIQAVRLGRRTLVPVTELERFAAALPSRNGTRATHTHSSSKNLVATPYGASGTPGGR